MQCSRCVTCTAKNCGSVPVRERTFRKPPQGKSRNPGPWHRPSRKKETQQNKFPSCVNGANKSFHSPTYTQSCPHCRSALAYNTAHHMNRICRFCHEPLQFTLRTKWCTTREQCDRININNCTSANKRQNSDTYCIRLTSSVYAS